MPVHFLFIDDAIVGPGDAERYRALLSAGDLRVTAVPPSRERQLVRESDLVPDDIDGFILDINLHDHIQVGSARFVGTGAGLAQDLRLLQATNVPEGQRPRPIVRLCAAQVFQQFLENDNSTTDVFDLGFDKETIADNANEARQSIAALPDIYQGISNIAQDAYHASAILGLQPDRYLALHSGFRNTYESELTKRVHEAANFLLNSLILRPGPLVDEALLAVRLGVNREHSLGWTRLLNRFSGAQYVGRGCRGFKRWWMNDVLLVWQGISQEPLYSVSSQERVAVLAKSGFGDLTALVSTTASPGDHPWAISAANDSELKLPVDIRFAYALATSVLPWLDPPLWCLEQARRNRTSLSLAEVTRARLKRDLQNSRLGGLDAGL